MSDHGPSKRVIPYIVATAAVFVSAALLKQVPVLVGGAATPLLVLEVLLIARAWGTGPALAGSTTAGIAFAYFFLPSKRFVEEPNDWVAFVAFTVTAIIVGELSARAERRQIETEQARREIEQLYQQLGAAFERASDAEAVRRNEQLKAALLDALTHNLRTPLTGIKAAVTALLGSHTAGASAAVGLSHDGRYELLQVIDEESDRLNRFIEGLSVVDQQGEASRPVSLHPARLDAIIEEALRRADTVLRHHVVRTVLDPAVEALNVEPAAVAEVLYMLLDNASKYSPPGTTILIESFRDSAHQARVAVSDQGAGVPDRFRERVFEKFFRIPGRESFDPRRGGVGLGLPIARRIVESQAGSIWIEAPAGGAGTRVVMALPMSGESVAADAAVVTERTA